jgi:FtsP/CotA-like multicopper oxidase with cupredoxin domain
MNKRRFARLVLPLMLIALLVGAQQGIAAQTKATRMSTKMRRITLAERLAAAKRAELGAATLGSSMPKALAVKPLALNPGGTPDYFGTTPNYANSPLPEYGPGIRKFVDSLAGLGPSGANNLGQFIPVAQAESTYPGADYYIIKLVEYSEKMHSDLPPTKLRGYMQVASNGATISPPSYLGPLIIAQRNRPVRVKFINALPTGAGGNLFLPVDTTLMGAGAGPAGGKYSQNRATLHLHGGLTPWISDGTQHQWITPAGENTPYPRGVSVRNVPDMANPGAGAATFYYTNQQSARLMFYHDHALGLTRLNVYAGEAAGYLLQDPVEQALVNGGSFKSNGATFTATAGTIPAEQIPLIIQDKSFVPNDTQLAAEDPTWDKSKWGGLGSLWFPHVYMPNQNPADMSGLSAVGRWDYGPWTTLAFAGLVHKPVPNPLAGTTPLEYALNPGTPNPSVVPESFMDTPLINGTAYPFVQVGRKAYRFRILNAANDRSFNLQLYYAKSNAPMWNANGTLNNANAGEVPMVPAAKPLDPAAAALWPATWPTDGRAGGVPDPTAVGPSMIQVGTEGGLLPAPVVLPNQPINYVTDRRSAAMGNISTKWDMNGEGKTLMLGPAERADVIVDFSQVPDGATLILYNDAPAPVPGFDPRYDYYTGDDDLTAVGGAPSTQPGYGPNTRTLMQIRVTNSLGASGQFALGALQTALPAAYAASQDKPIVPEKAYESAFKATYADTFARIQSTSLTFTPAAGGTAKTLPLGKKLINELFDEEYGRMNATLGVFMDNINPAIDPLIPFYQIDPPTEIVKNTANPVTPIGTAADGTQIWKITHNGVDTHAIHFHLFNVQVINRVGIDNALRPPDENELGWKETVRMNPTEDTIVAVRPTAPKLPWKLPNSIRLLDPTKPAGSMMGFSPRGPNGAAVATTNKLYDFGWEYVWHCHLLGHEENDMMRPLVFTVAPKGSSRLTRTVARAGIAAAVTLKWVNGWTTPAATTLVLQRATNPSFTVGVKTYNLAPTRLTFKDTGLRHRVTYYYRVRVENAAGISPWTSTVAARTN